MERSEECADRDRGLGVDEVQASHACKLISGSLASRKVPGTSIADDAGHLRRWRDGRNDHYKVFA